MFPEKRCFNRPNFVHQTPFSPNVWMVKKKPWSYSNPKKTTHPLGCSPKSLVFPDHPLRANPPTCVAAAALALRHQQKGATQWRQIGAGDTNMTQALHQLLGSQDGLPIGDVLKNPQSLLEEQRVK